MELARINSVSACDLRALVDECATEGLAVEMYGFRPSPDDVEIVEVVYVPSTGLAGVAWGADANWLNAGSAEDAVARWLDDHGPEDEAANRAAYRAGYYAASSGQPIDAVPLGDESVRDWWLQGWRDSDEGIVVLGLDDDDDAFVPHEAAQTAPRVLFDHVNEDTRNVWFTFPSGELLTAVETSFALGEIDWASGYVEGLGWDEQQTLAKRFEVLEPACIVAWRLAIAEMGG